MLITRYFLLCLGWDICLEFHGIPQLFWFRTFFLPEFWSKFVFPTIKHVSSKLEHVPNVLEYYPAIDSSNFMHQKKFPPFFIFPAKITSICFPSETSRYIFGGMIMFLPKLHVLVLSWCKFGSMIILLTKITQGANPVKMSFFQTLQKYYLSAQIYSTRFN